MSIVLNTPGRPRGSRRIRVIPTLLLDGKGRLVKTVKFGKRDYIGDPINAVRIFNSKQVDELVLLDIDCSIEEREPNYELIAEIASEACMPIAYGGGLDSVPRIERTVDCGVEKVILSSSLRHGVGLVEEAVIRWGSQSIVACLPIVKNWLGKPRVAVLQGRKSLKGSPEELARELAAAGAGEIIAYFIDRDGTWEGYDLAELRRITAATDTPVVACGGAGTLDDFRKAVTEGGCSAVAAGSMFIYQAKALGVLINYPSDQVLQQDVFDRK